MLTRTAHDNGIVTYQSPLLMQRGVRHAFSTRIGGVSDGPFKSLNFGNPAGDAPRDEESHLLDNYRRLQSAIGCPRALRAWVHQVHGRMVELIEREPENEYAETLEAEIRDRFSGQLPADALVSVVPNVLLTIRVADCVPVLLASDDGKVVAAVHAGWRGVVGNVTAKAVRTMHEAGADPATLVAAIGPCISVEHFEVGEEVAAEFYNQDLAASVHQAPGKKPHIDLVSAIQIQLQRAGIQQVDAHTLCTFRDPEEFFSHRRDHGVTGRMTAVIITNPT